MCGINFILDKRKRLDALPIQRMNEATQHRGREHRAWHCHEEQERQLFFGHNRLKIIDLEDQANQPMRSPDGRYILVFNGEIYNFQTLRYGLQARYQFRTQSDTEVLMYQLAYDAETKLLGEGKPHPYNGIYAFVWYDTEAKKLHFERDAFGTKPLYYYEDEHYLILSSEIRGILASGLVKKELNEAQVYHYLAYRYAHPQETFFKNIFPIGKREDMQGFGENKQSLLEDVQGLLQNKQGLGESRQGLLQKIQGLGENKQGLGESRQGLLEDVQGFGENKKAKLTQSLNHSITHSLNHSITQSLSHQTIGDVPFGLFLSGGVDSTLLLAMLQEQGHTNLPAFTIANKEKERDFGTEDYHFARLAGKQFGAKLHVLEVDNTLLKDLPTFVQSIDQPIADGAYFLTQHLAKEARKEVKFVLSGAGADELFAGYNRHQAFYYYQKFYSFFVVASPFVRMAGKLLPTGYEHPLRKPFRLFKKLFENISSSPTQTWDNFIRLKTSSILPQHFNAQHSMLNTQRSTFNTSPLLHDQQFYLPHDILALNDRAGMWHELEIRVPYLDNEVVHFANSLSLQTKLKHGKKWLLKELLNARDGKIYTQRRKEGFGVPLGKWLREQAGKDFIALLFDDDSRLARFLPAPALQYLVNQHLAQREDHSAELWALVLLEMWLREHF